MSAEKRWRLVCYDIRDDKRYRQAYKVIRGAGERIQYSVFRCRLDDLETERLRWRLAQAMSEDDALLIVDLCPTCARRVIAKNHVDGWQEEPATFRIVGGQETVLRPGASIVQDHEPAVGEGGAGTVAADPEENPAVSGVTTKEDT